MEGDPLPEGAVVTILARDADETFHSADEGNIEAAWAEEARRRFAEYKSGQVEAVPGDQAIANARRKLRESRNSSND